MEMPALHAYGRSLRRIVGGEFGPSGGDVRGGGGAWPDRLVAGGRELG
jgi:hypothetical protein